MQHIRGLHLGTSCSDRLAPAVYRSSQPLPSRQRRLEHWKCCAQHSASAAAGWVGLGVTLFVAAGPAEAGLIANQPYGGPAGDQASRVLVVDRQRIELLLANEFKERLHALPNDELVQMLDHLLASQQTTAPELFADVLSRQQRPQQERLQPAVAEQLAGGLRQGISQLWGFSQGLRQQSPSLAQPPANAPLQPPDAAATDSDEASAVGSMAQPPAPSVGWRVPWAMPAAGRNTSSDGPGGESSPEAISPQQVSQPPAAAEASSDSAQLLHRPFGLQPLQTQQGVSEQQQQVAVPAPGPASAASSSSSSSSSSKLESRTAAEALPGLSAGNTQPSKGPSSTAAQTAGGDVSQQLQLAQQQGSSTAARVQEDSDEAVLDDTGESDITGGLLFGKAGRRQELLPADEQQSAAGADGPAAASGLAAGAAAKLQGLFTWRPQLPFTQAPSPGTADSVPGSAVREAPATAAAAGSVEAASGAAGGLAGGVSAVAAAAGAGLKGLLELPGALADDVEAVLEDWRYEAADAVSAVWEQQGATVAAVVGLTAAAGGGVLLLSSLLQPLLNGELANSSKLSALLQGGDAAEDQSDEPASSSSSSSSEMTVQMSTTAAGQSPAAATGGGGGGADAALVTAGAEPPTAAAGAAASSSSGVLSGLASLMDNVGSADIDTADATAAAAAPSWPATAAVMQPDSSVADTFSSSSLLQPAAAGGPTVLWQREEPGSASLAAAAAAAPGAVGSLSSSAAAAAAAAGSSLPGSAGSILWQRVESEAAVAAGPSGSAAEGPGGILWQRLEAQPVLQQGVDTAAAAAAAISSAAAAASTVQGPLHMDGSGDSSGILWQASTAHEQPAVQLKLSSGVAAGDSSSSSSAVTGRRANRQRAGTGRLLSRLLSNAEDVSDNLHATPDQQQQQQLWPQWLPSAQQQPWQLHDATEQQQQQPQTYSTPWQQQWAPSDPTPDINRAWAPAAAAAAAAAAHPGSDGPAGPGSSSASQQQQRDPKSLWPAILATSSTAFSYASLASADFAELEVSLVLPADLPPDPWGTSPPGLVPSEQELAGLGVLQAELTGLAAAAAACRDAQGPVSPWCKQTAAHGSSTGSRECGQVWAAEGELETSGERVAGAGDDQGVGGAAEADSSGVEVCAVQSPESAAAGGTPDKAADGSPGGERPLQIIGFFQ